MPNRTCTTIKSLPLPDIEEREAQSTRGQVSKLKDDSESLTLILVKWFFSKYLILAFEGLPLTFSSSNSVFWLSGNLKKVLLKDYIGKLQKNF